MTVAPVRREVIVPGTPEAAFARFTDDIGRWWPLAGHSVGGAGGGVAFIGGQLVETCPDGSTAVWGEILDWEPGRRVRLAWHPGHPDGPCTPLARGWRPRRSAPIPASLNTPRSWGACATAAGWSRRGPSATLSEPA